MIGTAALIAIGLGSAAASAGTNIYATKKAGGINEKALTAQQASDKEAATIERERLAQSERARKEGMAADQQRWNDYVRVHEPYWNKGQQVYQNLLDLAGGSGPSPAMPTAGSPPPSAPAGPSMGMPPQSLMDLAQPSARPMSRGMAYASQPMEMPTPQGGGMSLMDLARMSMMAQPNAGSRYVN